MKYQKYYDVYVSLGTVRERNGKLSGAASNIYRRAVLFLDFDCKDYPELEQAMDFTQLVKKSNLFIMAVFNSGHGYHMYIAVEPVTNIRELTKINKQLAAMVGADMNATLPTQIVRVPTTFNHKKSDELYDYNDKSNWQRVTCVFNKIGESHYFRLNIDSVKRKLDLAQKNIETIAENRERNTNDSISTNWANCKTFYCIDRVRTEGADKGSRNFWLGRLTNWHKSQGHSYEFAQSDVLKWNSLCNPPKNENEVLRDFNNYWNTDYLLLGCPNSLKNLSDREKVEAFCEPAFCLTNPTINLPITTNSGLKMSNYLLKKRQMRKLTGYHFFVLTMIYFYVHDCGFKNFTVGNLKDKLVVELGHGRKKWTYRTMSDRHCDKVLNDLEVWNLIVISSPRGKPNSPRKYHRIRLVKRLRTFEDGFTVFCNSAATSLQLGAISYSDYRTYLCLLYHVQQGMNCSLDSLSGYLGIDKASVSRSLKKLMDCRMIIIRKALNNRGNTSYNMYSINDPQNIRGVDLNSRNVEGRRDSFNVDENAEILEDCQLEIQLIP